MREAIRGALERFGDLGDDAFISARQENLETIHQHSVVAERFGLFGELRRERRGTRDHTTLREWLSAAQPIRSAPWTLRWSSAEPLASRTPRRSTSAA